MSEVWMNYQQLAQHWGMSQDAARTRARRGNYQRRVGNQGQAEILVDSSAPIPKARKPRSEGQTRTITPSDTPDKETPSQAALEALEGHIATLKDQLTKAEAATLAERERVADLTAQLLRLTGELLEARKTEATPRRSWWQRLAG